MPNPQVRTVTTVEIGRAVGYSTQQVRDLERLGVIPAAERAANGYRRYGDAQLIALRAYRALAAAIGPVAARQLMPALIADPIDEAAAKIDDLHAAIARSRSLVVEARRGLDVVLADADADDAFAPQDAMAIGELADALGIRVSALRHWEREGLVAPDRSAPSGSRRYDARAISEARIVAALRSGGYGIPPMARVLDELRSHGPTAQARTLLDARLADLTRRSVGLLEASAHLHALLAERTPPVSA